MKKENGGRRFITIDWDRVDHLLECGCSGMEIAASLGFHYDTLYIRTVKEKKMSFTDYSASKRQKGDSLLRAAQFKNAMKGNTTMQVWLGKQRLGQRDDPKSNDEVSGELKEFIEYLKNKYEPKEQTNAGPES